MAELVAMASMVAAPAAQPTPLSNTERRESRSFELFVIELPLFCTFLIALIAEIVLALFAANQLLPPRLVPALAWSWYGPFWGGPAARLRLHWGSPPDAGANAIVRTATCNVGSSDDGPERVGVQHDQMTETILSANFEDDRAITEVTRRRHKRRYPAAESDAHGAASQTAFGVVMSQDDGLAQQLHYAVGRNTEAQINSDDP